MKRAVVIKTVDKTCCANDCPFLVPFDKMAYECGCSIDNAFVIRCVSLEKDCDRRLFIRSSECINSVIKED